MPRVSRRAAPEAQPELDVMTAEGVSSSHEEEAQRAKVEAAFAPEEAEAEEAPDESGLAEAVSIPAKRGRTRTAKGEATEAPPESTGGVEGFYQLNEDDEKLKILNYGREGTRKTTGATTSTQLGRTLVVSAEGGLKASALKKHGVDVANLMVWPGPGDPAITEPGLARRLEALHERLLAGFHRDPEFLYAVHLDSFSELFSVLRDQAQADRVNRALKKPGVDRDMINPDFTDRDDYGVATGQGRKILRRFRDLPCHVVITALEKYDEDEAGVVPAVSPAIRIDLLGMVDMVLYSKVDPIEDGEEATEFHRALTSSGVGGSSRGKDRYDALPRVLVEPTFRRILDYKMGDLVESEDPLQQAYHDIRNRREAEERARDEEKAARKAELEAAKTKAPPARRSRAKTAAPAA